MDTIPELEGWIIDVQELEKKLPQSAVKWNYPRDVILEIQNRAKHINKHFSGDLDRLLHWPRTKELEKDGVPYKDYRGFYDMNWEARFNRTSNWFVEMGFTKHETPYTIANNWDRAYVNATFLVPDNLKDDDNVPVMWFFHGGGFVRNPSSTHIFH
jgi:acetyl esterase/lipase